MHHTHVKLHVEGAHHTGAETDVDHILGGAVKQLRAAGHTVHVAEVHHETESEHGPHSLLDHPAAA